MTRLAALGLCVLGAGLVWFGSERRPFTQALALVALAGVGALLAGRGLFRRIVAVVIVLAGLGLAVSGTLTALIAGVLVVAGGVAAAITAPRWPVMGARYERASKPDGKADEADLWGALDRGEDPTAR